MATKSALRHRPQHSEDSSSHRDDSTTATFEGDSDFFTLDGASEHSACNLKPPTLKSNVSFGKVDVRVYERVVEDNTWLGIGWQYNKDTAAPVDAFHRLRHERGVDAVLDRHLLDGESGRPPVAEPRQLLRMSPSAPKPIRPARES